MGRKRVSSIDVARRAGVSQSAVSRVFSAGPTSSTVAAATRVRILQAAQELGYQPNALARAVFLGRSRIVAVLFSYLDNPFYADALERICHGLQEHGFHALVFMVRETTHDTPRVIGEILQYQVEGLVTASVELSSEICQRCHDRAIPVVMFNRTQDDPRLSSVTTDNVAGGAAAAAHLLGLGHRRIGVVAGWEGASTNRDREHGFAAALAAAGVSVTAREVGHFDLARTRLATLRMFDGAAPPSAVFVVNDYMAVTVLDTLRFEQRLAVPDDVAVVGFDDTAMAALPTYDLTTIRQPVEEMVAHTLRVLSARIADPARPPEHVALPGRLVVRGSTAVSSARSRHPRSATGR